MTTIVKSNTNDRIVKPNVTRTVLNSSARANIVKSSNAVKVSNARIGSNMDYTRFRYHKTPTPATDGAQLIFTLPDSESYVAGLLEVYLDGLLQIKDTDYTETTSQTFTLTTAPDSNENLRINYIKQ